MMKDKRPRSWKEMRDHRTTSQDLFIGRESQIKAFRDILSTPYEQRTKVIFNISGQGGIGKTTLLKEFRRISEELKQLTAYVDEGAQSNRVDDVPEALNRIATDFDKQGQKFNKFQERYKVYRQKRQELEVDPDAPQGFVAGLGRILAKASLGAAKLIPGTGAVLDLVESDTVANKTGEYVAFIASKLTNKDEVQLLREPLEILTPLFLEDLNRIAEKKTVILLFDTYEQTGLFLDDWLHSILNFRYGDLTPNFLLGIAGRDPLSRNKWADMEPWIIRSELEPFTKNEAWQYLISKGITDEAVIQEIWRLSSGGLPLLIGMMSQSIPTNKNLILDPCDEAVERFLKWELDATKHQLALNAALPRILNRDILHLLVDESVANDLFEWLKELSFVVKHPEEWQYHNIVRELILRYQRRISPQEWKAQHIQLANYYDKLRKGLELTNTQNLKNETWQKYTLEWLYHNLCIDPSLQMGMALNDWLMALDTSNGYAHGWAEAMNMAGIASGSEDMRSWGQKFQNGLRALEKNLWFEMDEVLSELLRETCLEDNCRAIALSLQGFFPLLCFLSKYDISQVKWDTEEIPDLNKIIENLTHALNLASKSEYFAFRGFVHLLKANIVEGKADINKFLEVAEPDDILRKQVEDILNIDFNNLIYVKELFNEQDIKEFSLFKINKIKEKINEEGNKEIEKLEEETRELKEKLQELQLKATKRNELIQKVLKLIEAYQEGEDFLNITDEALKIGFVFQKLTELLQRKKDNFSNLKVEFDEKNKDCRVEKEEIFKLEKDLKIKSENLKNFGIEAGKLLEQLRHI